MHALFYRPIDNATKIAARSVLLQIVIRDFVESVFNPAFPKLGNFQTAAAADIGDTVGTQNGVEGDRELLFLGGPANRAAKTLGDARSDRVTKAVFDALPSDLQAICIETDDPASTPSRRCRSLNWTNFARNMMSLGIERIAVSVLMTIASNSR